MIAAVWVVAGPAAAQSRSASPPIVIVQTRAAPALPTLASQIEAHISARVAIEVRSEPDADPLTFAERASQLVTGGEATLVVWIAPVDHGHLVFAAGPWPRRALIELIRVDDSIAPAELERTIALKVAGLLDALLAPGPGPDGEPGAVLGLGTGPAAVHHGPRWRMEIAGLVASERNERALDGRTTIAVGRNTTMGAWAITPMLGAYWQPSGTIEGEHGRAAITEQGGTLAVEAARRLGGFEGFLRPRLVFAVLRARGQSDDGRRGSATVLAPYAGTELGIRRALATSAWVGMVAGLEIAAERNTFLVDDETVVDLGRGRLHVGLTLTVGW